MDYNIIQLASIIISFIGIPAGMLLAHLTKEEKEWIKKPFEISFLLALLILVINTLYYFSLLGLVLSVIAFAIFLKFRKYLPIIVVMFLAYSLTNTTLFEITLGLTFILNIFYGSELMFDKN